MTLKASPPIDYKQAALQGPAYIKHDIINHMGVLTLDRPQALNALHPYMMYTLRQTLLAWQNNPDVHAVIVRSHCDRAFSAGGDLRAVYEAHQNNNTRLLDFLFQEEYQLDFLVHSFGKPYMSFIDGLVMGGGMGISMNGPYRLMSERAIAAMPETKIGFFPDAGATHFLNQCPGSVGLYLALTGNTCDSADAFYSGFGTHFIPHDLQQTVYEQLLTLTTSDHQDAACQIKKYLESYAPHHPDQNHSKLAHHRKAIDRFFGLSSLPDIFRGLTQASKTKEDPDHLFARDSLQTLQQRSPTSLFVTFEQLKRGQAFTSFQEVMEFEYTLSRHFLRFHDFLEGIRALIIDKDHRPQWSPQEITAITPQMIENHFSSLDHKLFR